MVKGLEPEKSLGLQSQDLPPTPDFDFGLKSGLEDSSDPSTRDSPRNLTRKREKTVDPQRSQGSKPWLDEFDVNQREPNSENGKATREDHLNRYPDIGPADPMERNKQSNTSSRSSHCHQTEREGDGQLRTPEQYITLKKKEAVARLMAAFNTWLDKKIVAIENAYEASEASGDSSMGTSKNNSPDKSESGKGTSKTSRGAKRQFDGDDDDNSSAGGDENGQDRGGNKRARKEPEQEKKYACPFFKHDPITFGKERCCAGPGWPSIHRLKEHLYRKHLLPKHVCARCQKPFREQKDLDDHLRADIRCEKVELIPVLGIDEATEAKLRMRKKHSPDATEEQRWKDIYMMIFPKANPRSLPSPYYEPKDAVELSNKAMLKRIKKELPALMQKQIESKFDQAQAELLNGFMDIARDVVYEFCTGLPRNERSPSTSPAASPRRSPTPSLPGASESTMATSAAAAAAAPPSDKDGVGESQLDLSPYLDNMFSEWPSMIDPGAGHDFAYYPFSYDIYGTGGETSDSGYASTGTVGNRAC